MSHTCASSFWRTLSVVSASVLSICLSRGPKIRCCTPLCLTCNARRCCLSDRYRKTVVCPTDIARRCCLATGIATRCCLSTSIARRCCLSDRYRNSVIYLQVSQDTFVCLTGIARCCCLSTGIARCCCLSTGVARRCCLSDRYRKMLLFVYRYRNTLLLVWQALQDSAVCPTDISRLCCLSTRYRKDGTRKDRPRTQRVPPRKRMTLRQSYSSVSVSALVWITGASFWSEWRCWL